ncbi:non-ribosomal peptide synthetase [Klugiella xanthotipulae]|nr:non-ribosomal peptide synthetase [Klugiella xanthotipulae]
MFTPEIRYPATFSQKAMFVQHHTHPQDVSFDLAAAYRLPATTDVEKLFRATSALFPAMPGINTHFFRRETEVEAVIQPGSVSVAWASVDPACPADEEDAWVALATGHLIESGPIRPETGPPLIARLYRGRSANYLVIVCSHLVVDAYAFYRGMDILASLYNAPEAEWADLIAGGAEHPGSVPAAPVIQKRVDDYLDLLSTADLLTNPGLAARPTLDGIRGRHHIHTVEGAASTVFRSSAAATEFGAVAVTYAIYAATLHRLCPTDTVVIGMPVANRAGYRAKQAIGYFVNTLPLPLTITAETTWWELCAQVSRGIRLVQTCQGLDLAAHTRDSDRLDRAYRAADNAVTFYQQALAPTLDGVELISLPLERTALSYPLALAIADNGERYVVDLAIADSINGSELAAFFATSWDTAVANPHTPVVTGSVWAAAETAAPPTTHADDHTVVHRILAAAAANPEAIALRDSGNTGTEPTEVGGDIGVLSYGELAERMRAIANLLHRDGASRYVLLTMPAGIPAVVTMLAVMASGRAYVPIDPAAPAHRADLIRRRVREELGTMPTEYTATDSDRLWAAPTATDTAGVIEARGDRPAYVIFTSGSTGEPKGVVVPGGNVADLLDSTGERLGLGPADTWCLFHSTAFDFSVWEMFGCLATGGTLVIPRGEEVSNPQAFATFLQRERVTVLNQTPSALRRLVAVSGLLPANAMESVRLIVCGGEALYPADLQPWVQHHGDTARVANMYGITETTVHVTLHDLTAADIATETRSPIGRPLDHLADVVIDPYGRPVWDGHPGELLVTGSALATGYLGRDDLTAERFRTIIDGGIPTRAYRTGDSVVCGTTAGDEGGALTYVGRIDNQVQLRGYRIELGEIESALVTAAGCRGVVVRLCEPAGAEPFLAAWVTLDQPLTEREVRGRLDGHLPPYMIPAAITVLPSIPLTHNGKPDIERLPDPGARVGGAETATAPTAVEGASLPLADRIAHIWSEVIGTGPVGVHDRFMDVGGTSMHVMHVYDRLRTELDLDDLNLVDLFEFATANDLATHLLSRSDIYPINVNRERTPR